MAEKLLNAILHNDISTEVLFQWISAKDQQRNQTFEFSKFPCTTGEFISHFLNYIHEDAPSFDTFTTKSITNNFKNKTEQHLTKKRTSLLSDIKNDMKITYSHTFPVISNKCSYDADKRNVNGDSRVYGSSTPKLMKIQLDNTLDSSYTSPVSPLYSRNNFSTPRSRNSFTKSSEKNLCLGDFIVQRKNSTKKKVQRNLSEIIDKKEYSNIENKKSRRINPTNLNQKKFNNSFNGSENSFNFKNSFIELSVDNLNEQRNLLAEERLKIKNNIDDLVKIPNVKLQTFSNKIEIKALPEKVTFVPQLDTLINVYMYLLNNNYTLNLASEIYFLISLLLSKQYMNDNLDNIDLEIQILEETGVNQKEIFKTVHNCVYFAVNALKLWTEHLAAFDRTTLKLLYENERLTLFSESFSLSLMSIYNNKLEQLKESVENIQNNVCFISDTDNRDNFASDASFHAFRKQRDLFYEILRIWEQNHFMSEWNFSVALGGKIRSLLNLYNDPVNYRHFARLFKMQLLTTCRHANNDEQQSSILTSLPNVDADKLYRLKNRLVTKQNDNNLNSTPTFTGDQEFYKEFILASAFHIFHAHLRDALILEITQLTSFEILENDEKDYAVDATTRNSYFTSLKVLRTLAKFLGFLESLPYRTDNKMISEKVAKAEIETRKWYQPSFDIKLVIFNSLKSKTLTLTVPWICKYLSMLDYVTLRLPYFDKILEMLFCIYYSTCPMRDRSFSLLYNIMLIRLSLGWLFELPHFPSELYFNWISHFSSKDLSKFLYLNLTTLSLDQTNSNTAGNKDRKSPSLDELDIVDQTILYTFCPYLEGFRKLLAMNSSNTGNVVKHITPLSALESVDVSEKKLKFQLEQAFFDGQPVSVRKTVEFMSERVASACVKHICNNLVPEFKKNSIEEVKITFQNFKDNCEDNKLESLLTTKANELSSQYLRRLQEVCTTETEKLTNERIAMSVDSLLAVDELQQTKNTCVAIAKRLCFERVQQWVKSHVNIGLFSKVFNMEIQKLIIVPDKEPRNKPLFMLPSGGRNVNHNDDTLSAVKIVENIRNLSTDLLETKTICSASLQDTLKAAEKTILERCDVNDHILSLINRMLVDLILLLLTHNAEYFEENLPFFVNHWKQFAKEKEQLFRTLISPRNIMLIGQSKNVSKSWLCLSDFVIKLIEVELISCETFEAQCIQMYQNDWDVDTQKYLSTCFQAVLDGIASKGPNVNKFPYLLNFLSSYCSNMDL